MVILCSWGALLILLILLSLEVQRKSWEKLFFTSTAPTAALSRQLGTDPVCSVQRSSGVICWSCFWVPQCSCSSAASPLLWQSLCCVLSLLSCCVRSSPRFTVGKVKPCPQSQVLTQFSLLSKATGAATARLSEAAVLCSSTRFFSAKFPYGIWGLSCL